MLRRFLATDTNLKEGTPPLEAGRLDSRPLPQEGGTLDKTDEQLWPVFVNPGCQKVCVEAVTANGGFGGVADEPSIRGRFSGFLPSRNLAILTLGAGNPWITIEYSET